MSIKLKFNGGDPVLVFSGTGTVSLESLGLTMRSEVDAERARTWSERDRRARREAAEAAQSPLNMRALQIRVKTLEAEVIPELCRELDEMRAQRQFLFRSFRSACMEYGATQGMQDYACDVADGALRVLGVDIKAPRRETVRENAP